MLRRNNVVLHRSKAAAWRRYRAPRRAWLLGGMLLCAGATASRASAAAPPDAGLPAGAARAVFESALDLVGRDDATAAARLEALADADPTGDYADDALAEAAQLLEERLGRPDRARDLYARLLALFPASRLALRARARLDFLDANLRTGAAPLAEYERILCGFSGRPPAESARRMAALLAAHPDFALADKALLWLAGLHAREGHADEAERRFREVEARFPASQAWALARTGRADLALATGHPLRARSLYRSMLEAPAPVDPSRSTADAARAGLRRAQAALVRLVGLWLAVGWLAGFTVFALLAAWPLRRPWPPPTELLFYLPVAALFVAAGVRENRTIAAATAIVAGGGAALLLVSSLAVRRRIERRALPRGARPLGALALTLAVGALLYVAVHLTNLTDVVLETIRNGPAR